MKINKHFAKLLNVTKRFLVLKGSAGSGKSYFVAQMILIRLVSQDYERVLCLRKIKDTIKNSCFELIKSIASELANEIIEDVRKDNPDLDLKASDLFVFTSSPMECRCFNGNKIIFAGIDDPEKVKSIADITTVWAEEATEFDQADIEQLNLRLRTVRGTLQFVLTFNPIDEEHWIKSFFYDPTDENGVERQDGIIENTYCHNSTYRQNIHNLDPEYCRQLEALRERNYNYWKVYANGEWGTLPKGKILTNWEIIDCDKRLAMYRNIGCGQDYGFNHASVNLLCGEKDDSLYVLKEVYCKTMTNQEFINLANEGILSPAREELGRNILIYSESAEPDRNKEFRQAGHNIIEVEKKGSFVRDSVNKLKEYNKIYIDKSCANTIREIKKWCWKVDKDGRVYDTPVEVDDDCMAALRYYGISVKKVPKKSKTIDFKVGLAGRMR